MEREELRNGLTVLIQERKESPTVHVCVSIEAGQRFDPPGQRGLARLTAKMIPRGTGRKTTGQVAILLAGAVLTESVFSWPGMGRYLVERISLRDYTAVQSTIAMFAIFVALISLTVDIIYSLLDPRVKY